MRDELMSTVPAHVRAAARVADKYIGRDSQPRGAEAMRARQKQETLELEQALEHVRRGMSSGALGKAGRLFLERIERVLERDYGVHQRIKPDNQ